MTWPSKDLIPRPPYDIGSICGYDQIYSFHGYLFASGVPNPRIEIRTTEEIYTTDFTFSLVYIH